MPLNSVRTRMSSPPGGGSVSLRISPRPGSTIQKALAPVTRATILPRSTIPRVPLTVIAAELFPGTLYALKAAAVFAGVLVLVRVFVARYHPFPRFGPANQVTTVRAALVALVAGLIGEPHLPAYATAAAIISALVATLDFLDGWLARRTGMSSAFGARFDMEVDALLILVLSILAWQYEKAGAWIVLAGLLRYFFVAAGWVFPWMERPLPPSRRRQTVCVIQIVGLSVVMLPAVVPPVSVWIAAALLLTLSVSFLVDVIWLRRASGGETSAEPNATYKWIVLGAALILLNAAVTFHNIWPTPAVGWRGQVSLELAVVLLAWVVIHRLFGSIPRLLVASLAVLWLVLAIGRYIDVTAPALWGRPLNFYWDLQFIPDVAAMVARAARPSLLAMAVVAAIMLLVLPYVVLRRAFAILSAALEQRAERRALAALAIAAVIVFAVQRA